MAGYSYILRRVVRRDQLPKLVTGKAQPKTELKTDAARPSQRRGQPKSNVLTVEAPQPPVIAKNAADVVPKPPKKSDG